MAVRNGIPYAIDFCNPAPDAEVTSVGQENFEWVVEHATKMAIERAQMQKPGQDNLTWGTFVRDGVTNFQKNTRLAKSETTEEKPKESKPKIEKATRAKSKK
jgi:hypothetical protein